jgi:endonuclease III
MDIEKTMQFILETQAKHEIAIQQWDERFLKFQQEVGQRFSTLVDVSLSLARHGEETDRRIRELTDAQASTDGKINALIGTVEKLIKREGGRT